MTVCPTPIRLAKALAALALAVSACGLSHVALWLARSFVRRNVVQQ